MPGVGGDVAERRPGLRAWITAARLTRSYFEFVPLGLGAALAARGGHLDASRLLLMVALVLAMHPAIRYLNDVNDVASGVDRPGAVEPAHSLRQGLELRAVRRVAIALFALVAALSLWLTLTTDWRLALLAVLGLVAAFTYAAGPWPYGYRGLGEVAEGLGWGPYAVLISTAIISDGRHLVGPFDWIAATAVGLFAAAVNLANNMTDAETDRAAGKITLPQLLGARTSAWLFAGLTLVPYMLLFALSWHERNWIYLVPLLSLPIALHGARQFFQQLQDSISLLSVVKLTGALAAAFGVLLIVSIGISTVQGR